MPGTTRRASKTFDTKRAAASWLAEQRTKLDAGEDLTAKAKIKEQISLGELAERYLKKLEDSGASPNTLVSTESLLRVRVLTAFGKDTLIKDITEQDIAQWYGNLYSTYSTGSVDTSYATLRTLFRFAVDNYLLAESPCKLRAKKRRTPVVADEQVARPEQVKALYHAIDKRMALAVLLAAWCALRQGEILALRRGSFSGLDSEDPTVTIDRQILQKTGEVGPTKNGDPRTISIPKTVAQAVSEHLDAYCQTGDDAWLFPRLDSPGTPLHHNTLRHAWDHARQAAKMGGFKFHDLRHTGLTQFARQGATYAELLHRGGHRDIQVALRYQHWSMERDRELTARMENLVQV